MEIVLVLVGLGNMVQKYIIITWYAWGSKFESHFWKIKEYSPRPLQKQKSACPVNVFQPKSFHFFPKPILLQPIKK